MNGHISNLAAFVRGASRLAWLGHIRPVTGTEAGGTGRAAREGADAWHRPVGEIIASRSARVSNRDAATVAAYRRVHTILSRGRE